MDTERPVLPIHEFRSEDGTVIEEFFRSRPIPDSLVVDGTTYRRIVSSSVVNRNDFTTTHGVNGMFHPSLDCYVKSHLDAERIAHSRGKVLCSELGEDGGESIRTKSQGLRSELTATTRRVKDKTKADLKGFTGTKEQAIELAIPAKACLDPDSDVRKVYELQQLLIGDQNGNEDQDDYGSPSDLAIG